MHFPSSRRRDGFSLLEIILYVGLTAMVMAGALQTMLIVTDAREKARFSSEQTHALQLVAYRIDVSMMNAVAVTTASSTFGSDAGVLTLQMADATRNPTVFSISGQRIYIKEGSAAALPLTPAGISVSRLRFDNLTGATGLSIVRIQIASASTTPSKQRAAMATLDTSVSLRQ